MEKSMTTTTFDLDGYQVSRHLGVVRGIIIQFDPPFFIVSFSHPYLEIN
jgi:hypothetical protein